ncbi:hypothetical protein T11_17693 [Trichinella zimbabwensis]|uniref:Uncharacterized protein n=1 Tax=Trichinella zimbabwensis TaxID=268475 RepID=A0A0V1I7K3_9BILA|nr:hypothetical protein T11_17693 [Trichinella zimbabwensis]
MTVEIIISEQKLFIPKKQCNQNQKVDYQIHRLLVQVFTEPIVQGLFTSVRWSNFIRSTDPSRWPSAVHAGFPRLWNIMQQSLRFGQLRHG